MKKSSCLPFGSCLAIGLTMGIVLDKLVMGLVIGCALGGYFEWKKKKDKKDDI